ncbi:hypothetical protein JOB18_017281 [Solea senegalensis]|uniref:Uncharacterized protein n=1 Tax=Solea senegalensis TaxID=28829 RepID=A0AAV6SRZ0_SOLSE|nr:hypothetical protein JOB18_017281 [Solea senegalensis]
MLHPHVTALQFSIGDADDDKEDKEPSSKVPPQPRRKPYERENYIVIQVLPCQILY